MHSPVTPAQARQLEAERAILLKEKDILVDLVKIVNGEVQPGEKPEVITRAVRMGYPIPLKYTQSWSSLKAIYLWAIKAQDSEMIEWSTKQIISAYGPASILPLQEDARKINKSAQLDQTPREEFLRTYRTMNGGDLSAFIRKHSKSDTDSFWIKQLKRLNTTNQTRCSILGKPFATEPILPHSATIRASIELEDTMTRDQAKLKPMKIISESNVAGYVTVPMLIDVHHRFMNWEAIVNHPILAKKFIVGRVVPDEVIVALLKYYRAPEAVWRQFCKQ